MSRTVGLFDVDPDIQAVRDMRVGPATEYDVHRLCEDHHYTKTGGNISWRYGLWSGFSLLGAVAYNLPTRSVCTSVFGEIGTHHVWHMGRLICIDEAPRNSESRLIGGSLRLIERDHSEVWAVLTYAATSEGHIGTVYQATNALYIGMGGRVAANSGYVDQEGRTHSSAYGGGYLTVEQAKVRGWEPFRAEPKHRYIYLLGDKRERRQRRAMLRYPVLPYPKATES